MLPWLAVLAIAACGGSSGTHPHDMSAAEHEHQASLHDQEAANAHPAPAPSSCGKAGACWASLAGDDHRRVAAEHRAASTALREAEASACAGIADEDRDTSPFEHRADIASVAPLVERTNNGKQTAMHEVGATVTFRAVPGMTAEWLQRLVDCHLARNAVLGHDLAAMPDCPLVPRGVTARVHSVGDGFAVDIRGDGADATREVIARAGHLQP